MVDEDAFRSFFADTMLAVGEGAFANAFDPFLVDEVSFNPLFVVEDDESFLRDMTGNHPAVPHISHSRGWTLV